MTKTFSSLLNWSRSGFLILSLCLASQAFAASSPEFNSYWYQGEAELTSYTLEQARYGEVHRGDAVLIFVTEDFSQSKQVKLDNPAAAGKDAAKILKLNLTKNFNTGVYPYSMMTSVFTPVDREQALSPIKVTTSSQEWCGHSFTQLNWQENGYRVREYSYFESEGDQDLNLKAIATEDGLWTLLRIDPTALPTGLIRLIPGSMYQRLSHVPWRVQEAKAEMTVDPQDKDLMVYSLDYPQLRRSLSIHFRKEFPHEIEKWEETTATGRGQGAKRLTTRAVKNKRLMLDYWRRNGLEDLGLRKDLGLD